MKNMSDKKKATKDLKQISNIFKKHNIEIWLDAGTLLGAIREKDFIEWDEDIDLAIKDKSDEDLFKIEIIKDLKKNGWLMFKKYGRGVKILNKNHSSKIDICYYNTKRDECLYREHITMNEIGRILDFLIWIFNLNPVEFKYESRLSIKKLKYIYKIINIIPSRIRKKFIILFKYLEKTIATEKHIFKIPYDFIYPLKKINFRGIECYIPNNEKDLLVVYYGKNWKKPIKNYKHGSWTTRIKENEKFIKEKYPDFFWRDLCEKS